MLILHVWSRASFLACSLLVSTALFSQVESVALDESIQRFDSLVASSISNTHLVDSIAYTTFYDGDIYSRIVQWSLKIDSFTTRNYRRFTRYDLGSQDSTIVIYRSLVFKKDTEIFTRRFELDSLGRQYESTHTYTFRDSLTSSTYYTSYQFQANGDTVGSSRVRLDSLVTLGIPNADFKIVRSEYVNDNWEPSAETYLTFSSRAPRIDFRLDRDYDTQLQAWAPGRYHSRSVTGNIAAGNTVLFDTSGVGLFTANPIQERVSQTTINTTIISPVESMIFSEYRGQSSGATSASNISRIHLYSSSGLLLEDFGQGYAVNNSTGVVIGPEREFHYSYSYLPNTDLLERLITIDSTYVSGTALQSKLRYYYSQVSSNEPLPTQFPTTDCFDRIYVDGANLIAIPSKGMGNGQVSLFSIGGKLVAQYTVQSGQQLNVALPQASGIYILTHNGTQGVCSQQVFVP